MQQRATLAAAAWRLNTPLVGRSGALSSRTGGQPPCCSAAPATRRAGGCWHERALAAALLHAVAPKAGRSTVRWLGRGLRGRIRGGWAEGRRRRR